ncbi:MAG: SDR family NAD(P)-dependent oxidoreductase [Tepidisphaerales bacterium]
MSRRIIILGARSAIARELARLLAGEPQTQIVLAGRDVAELEYDAADLRIRSGAVASARQSAASARTGGVWPTPPPPTSAGEGTGGTSFDCPGNRSGAEVSVARFDALDYASHAEAWKRWTEGFDGEIGVVICFGTLPEQAKAQDDAELARLAIESNFTGAVSILTPAANTLAARRSGFICVIGSVAGDRGRQSNYVYGSAKAGLSAFVQGMRQRLAQVGVRVLTVKPGFVDTAMTFGLPGMFLVASPARVAADIHRAIRRGRNVIYTPWFWRWIMLIIRVIPESVFARLKL